ncbi:unnamed protein product [Meganyctiphanes norvegica]|uniref:SET domain-containing protein n=1 Tax=Meganyctiphanes norvegica TaxID=48144 RepID=A0AAV2S1K5_MEGNR
MTIDKKNMEGPTFNSICKNLLEALGTSNRLKDVHNICRLGESPEFMFRALWKLKEFHNCLNVKLIPPSKSEKEARMNIARGREMLNDKQYYDALTYINRGLMKAPSPPYCILENRNGKGTNNLEKNISENSALVNGYRDRSAVLYSLQQYKKCISDIDTADILGCSNGDKDSLLNRKSECIRHIDEEKEEKLNPTISEKSCDIIVKQAVDQIDSLNQQMNSIKSSNGDLPIQKTIELLLQGTNKVFNSFPDIPQTFVSSKYILVNEENEFELCDPNLKIPSLSAAVNIEYTPEKGRFVVAARDIRPGEPVHLEKCFIGLPDMEQRETCCCVCLTQCYTPIPCSNCDIVVFCSESCQKVDQIHKIECDMLPTCLALGMDEHAMQTCRILIKLTFVELKNIVPILKQETKRETRSKQGFNSDGYYDSKEYRTVYHLENNINERKSMELFCKCVRAFLLLNILKESKKFFVEKSGEILIPSNEDFILTGSTILNHLLALPLNTYALYGCQIDINASVGEANDENIAMGVFGGASLFNHSCNPATSRSNYGDVLVMYAKCFIPSGSEVSTTYGDTYNVDIKEERISRLLMDYKFECTCEACINNWPLASDMKIDIKLKNLEPCYRKLLENNFVEKIIEHCTETKKSYLVDDDKVKMLLLEDIMTNTIEFLDKCIELPSRHYLLAQKVLTQCFEKSASSYNFRV